MWAGGSKDFPYEPINGTDYNTVNKKGYTVGLVYAQADVLPPILSVWLSSNLWVSVPQGIQAADGHVVLQGVVDLRAVLPEVSVAHAHEAHAVLDVGLLGSPHRVQAVERRPARPVQDIAAPPKALCCRPGGKVLRKAACGPAEMQMEGVPGDGPEVARLAEAV